MRCKLDTGKSTKKSTLAGSQSNGVLALDIGGARVHALPLGEVLIDTDAVDGAILGADGTATVSIQGVSARFAPSVADVGQLARDVGGPFPWPGIAVTADGVLVANIAGKRYALRPGWVSEADEIAGFGERDGMLMYGWQGRRHEFHAAVADWGRFAAAVAAGLPGATVRTNADGTVSIEHPSQRLWLKPEMELGTAPAGTGVWWVEPDGRLMLRNADGSAQAFRLE